MDPTLIGDAGTTSVVRVGLGWRARDVERQASAHVQFPDRDRSAAIIEDTLTSLAYADPQHGFTLPPGRYVRLDQFAGRVFRATATPHGTALSDAGVRATLRSIGIAFADAGWRPAPGIWAGVDGALAFARRRVSDPNSGTGFVDVQGWRVPRASAPSSALPPGARSSTDQWDGPEAVLSIRPLPPRTGDGAAEPPKYVVQVAISDGALETALSFMVTARRTREPNAPRTLVSWDRSPDEAVRPPAVPFAQR